MGKHALVRWALGVDWIEVSAAVGVLYGWLVVRVRRRGTEWPRIRTICFFAGIAAHLGVILSPIDSYDNVSFLLHTIEHLAMVFLAAPLVALGAPIRLLQQASPAGLRRRVIDPFVESSGVRFITNPAVVWTSFVGFFLATHLIPPVYDATLTSGGLHLIVHSVYLVTAFLFWSMVAGSESFASKLKLPRRILYSAALIPVALFLGLDLILESDPLYARYFVLPRPWGGSAAVVSQHLGGLAVLVAGMTAASVAMLVVRASARHTAEGSRAT